jgi:probable F420-dependent oxidoreductase
MANHLKFGYLVPTRDAVMRSSGGRADIRPMLELAVQAERKGFDSVWVGDSILARPRFEPLTTLAAISTLTTHVQLGTAIYLSPLRHPLPLAHTAGNVDLLSGGRFLFGLGIGPDTPPVRAEYAACGMDVHKRGQLQEEGLHVMKALWTGKPVTFRGQFYNIADVTLHPLPSSDGGPPVLLAGGSGRPLQRIARFADGWLPISKSPQEFINQWEQLRGYCAQAGRDPEILLRVLYVTVNVNPDRRRAEAETEAFLKAYYGAAWEHIFNTQGIASGEPERCAEFLRGFARAGVNHFIVRFSGTRQEEQMDRFITEVAPFGIA